MKTLTQTAYFLCIYLLITVHFALSASISSDTLTIKIDEDRGELSILHQYEDHVDERTVQLGNIRLPGVSEPQIIGVQIPLELIQSSPDRVDYHISMQMDEKTFYLTLKTEGNSLLIAFDTEPIPDVWSMKMPELHQEESIELLRKEPSFSEVRLLPGMIALEESDSDGYLVLSYQEGSIMNFSNRLDQRRDFTLFENSGFTMPFWGVTTPEQSILCIVEYLYTRILYEPGESTLQLSPRFFSDPHSHPIKMKIEFMGRAKNYLDLAKQYRNHLIENDDLPSLKDKLQKKPQLIHLLEGANAKFPIYMSHEQRPDENGVTPPPRVHHYQSFEDVVEIMSDMKSKGVDRLMAIWWGWGKEGYDRLHPDFLPPNPELGGEPAFVKATQAIQEMGFSIGFHDNYTDIYEAAPSFDAGSHCLMGSDGKNRMGGFWAGGQCWLLCSTPGLHFAKRNFEQMKDYSLDACFIDVLTAAPLFDCYSPLHPHSKWGDMKNKRAMMEMASDYFGIFGTEHGFSWGVDACDYFEGITTDPETSNEWFRPIGTSVPLFSAVYHDAIVHYMHQGGTVHHHRPARFLRNLRAGGGSFYNIVRSNYEDPQWQEYFLKTYSISSKLMQGSWQHPLTQHEFLTADNTVEMCRYGDDIFIVINSSENEFKGSIQRDVLGRLNQKVDITLPPHGFIISTPDFSAMHVSKWGEMSLATPGWIELQAVEGEKLADGKVIHITNWQDDLQIHNFPLPKGTSRVALDDLFGR